MRIRLQLAPDHASRFLPQASDPIPPIREEVFDVDVNDVVECIHEHIKEAHEQNWEIDHISLGMQSYLALSLWELRDCPNAYVTAPTGELTFVGYSCKPDHTHTRGVRVMLRPSSAVRAWRR